MIPDTHVHLVASTRRSAARGYPSSTRRPAKRRRWQGRCRRVMTARMSGDRARTAAAACCSTAVGGAPPSCWPSPASSVHASAQSREEEDYPARVDDARRPPEGVRRRRSSQPFAKVMACVARPSALRAAAALLTPALLGRPAAPLFVRSFASAGAVLTPLRGVCFRERRERETRWLSTSAGIMCHRHVQRHHRERRQAVRGGDQ